MNEIFKSPQFWIIAIPIALLFLACVVYLWWWISDKNSKKTKVFRICISAMILLSLLWCGFCFLDNIFIFDRSAVIRNGVLIWDDKEYLPASGYYNVDDPIAMTDNGSHIYRVTGDKSHSFIALKRNESTALYAKKGICVANEGIITMITLDGVMLKSGELLRTIESIRDGFVTSFVYTDSEIWHTTEHKEFNELCIYYNDCPVGIRTHDYIGRLNGDIVYARRQDNGEYFTYDMFLLEGEMARIISEHLD